MINPSTGTVGDSCTQTLVSIQGLDTAVPHVVNADCPARFCSFVLPYGRRFTLLCYLALSSRKPLRRRPSVTLLCRQQRSIVLGCPVQVCLNRAGCPRAPPLASSVPSSSHQSVNKPLPKALSLIAILPYYNTFGAQRHGTDTGKASKECRCKNLLLSQILKVRSMDDEWQCSTQHWHVKLKKLPKQPSNEQGALQGTPTSAPSDHWDARVRGKVE